MSTTQCTKSYLFKKERKVGPFLLLTEAQAKTSCLALEIIPDPVYPKKVFREMARE